MELEFMSDAAVGDAELFIYLDEPGLEALLAAVEAARGGDHQHLLAESWGGKELTVSSGSVRSFKKVTITFGGRDSSHTSENG
jgi:hypothetical protein